LNDVFEYDKLDSLGGGRMVKDQVEEKISEFKEGSELLFFEKYVRPLSRSEQYSLIKARAVQNAQKRFTRFSFWRVFSRKSR
jgi:hypothetical protein